MQPKLKGFLSLLGTSCIYGSFGLLVRALIPYLTPNQMTFARSLVVFLIILFVLIIKRVSFFKVPKHLILPLIIHSATFAVTIFLFTYAVTMTSLSKATFSFYATTLLTSLCISVLFFHEGLGRRKVMSMTLALGGLIFFILPQGIDSIGLGMVFTGIAGIADVVTNSMKKFLGGKVDPLVLVLYQMFGGLLVGIVLIALSNQYEIIRPFDLSGILWLLFFALNFFLLSYLTIYGFQHFDLNLGTIILSMEFVWATFIGYFLYQEALNNFQIVGMILLALSVISMNLPQRKTKSY